jgi:hypothetical protein
VRNRQHGRIDSAEIRTGDLHAVAIGLRGNDADRVRAGLEDRASDIERLRHGSVDTWGVCANAAGTMISSAKALISMNLNVCFIGNLLLVAHRRTNLR